MNWPVLFWICLGIVAAFLIFREIYCWYTKANEMISLKKDQIKHQIETNQLLKKLVRA